MNQPGSTLHDIGWAALGLVFLAAFIVLDALLVVGLCWVWDRAYWPILAVVLLGIVVAVRD